MGLSDGSHHLFPPYFVPPLSDPSSVESLENLSGGSHCGGRLAAFLMYQVGQESQELQWRKTFIATTHE